MRPSPTARSRNTACSGSRSTPLHEALKARRPRQKRAAHFAWGGGRGRLRHLRLRPGRLGPRLLQGAAMTLLVSACGLLIGAAIGALVAWARLSGHRLAGAAGEAYAALFRGLPELLVVYFVYFGTSTLLTGARQPRRATRGSSACPRSSPARSRSASFPAPIRRKCSAPPISPSRRGELEAAVSVGMNRLLMFRRIIAPQVLRFALPGLGNLVAGGAEGLLAHLRHRPHRAHAGEPDRGRLHPSAVRLLSRRDGALPDHDADNDPRVRRRRGARDPRHAPRSRGERMDWGFIGATIHAASRRRAADARGLGAVGDPRRARRRGRDVDAGQRLEAARDHRPRLCRALPRDAAPHSAVHRLLRPCVAAGGPSQPLLALPARRLQLRRAFARRSAPPAISPKSSAARCSPCRTGRSRRPAPAACRAS